MEVSSRIVEGFYEGIAGLACLIASDRWLKRGSVEASRGRLKRDMGTHRVGLGANRCRSTRQLQSVAVRRGRGQPFDPARFLRSITWALRRIPRDEDSRILS